MSWILCSLDYTGASMVLFLDFVSDIEVIGVGVIRLCVLRVVLGIVRVFYSFRVFECGVNSQGCFGVEDSRIVLGTIVRLSLVRFLPCVWGVCVSL